jgi:hypothetical protein
MGASDFRSLMSSSLLFRLVGGCAIYLRQVPDLHGYRLFLV